MSAPSEIVRLTYFQGYGLAEQARWMVAAVVGDNWENVGFEAREEFLKLRDDDMLLFNQVPLLEIDGLRLVQGQAIVRYLARKGGLDGKTDVEKVVVDMVCENIKDVRGPSASLPFSDDKESVLANAVALVDKFFPRIEKLLVENNGKFVSSGMSVADILVAEAVHELFTDGKMVNQKVLEQYPNILAVYKNVIALPNIASYLASDKRYPFPHGEIGVVYKANVNSVLGR
jgi:glutathione S-transferase